MDEETQQQQAQEHEKREEQEDQGTADEARRGSTMTRQGSNPQKWPSLERARHSERREHNTDPN
eukprot:5800250-Pyramimonas_sp.AAC.1